MYRILKIASLIVFLSSASLAQIAVIANMSVPISSANQRTTLDIYSLSIQTWENGSAITVVTLKGNDSVVKTFHKFLGRTPLEMRKLWMRIQLSGEGRVPIALSSEAEVAEEIASTPGAIGFVSSDHVPKNVKVLFVIE